MHLNALKCIATFLNDSLRIFNLSHECAQLRQMMRYDQHIGNVTNVFYLTLEIIAKGQRGTRSHSNKSFLQCAANGLVSFEAVRRFS